MSYRRGRGRRARRGWPSRPAAGAGRRRAWSPCSSTSPGDVPGEHLARVVVAQRLLDPPRTRSGPSRSKTLGPLVGVRGRAVERVAEQLGRRLVAGDDHQEEERHDLVVVEPVAVDLGLEQRATSGPRSAASGARSTIVGVVADQRRSRPPCRRAGRRARPPRGAPAGRPPAQFVAVGLRHAEHLGDHVHRELAGEAPRSSRPHPPAAATSVEVAPVIRGCAARARHPARGEAAGDQGAHPDVPRRVHREERHRLARPGSTRPVERDAVALE